MLISWERVEEKAARLGIMSAFGMTCSENSVDVVKADSNTLSTNQKGWSIKTALPLLTHGYKYFGTVGWVKNKAFSVWRRIDMQGDRNSIFSCISKDM